MMKKGVFLFALVVCLTACGTKDNVTQLNETSEKVTSAETISNEENIEESIGIVEESQESLEETTETVEETNESTEEVTSEVEEKVVSTIDGKNIEAVNLNDTSIWETGFYSKEKRIKEDSSRAYTLGYATIEPNTSYVKVSNGAPAILVTVFDENKEFLKTYDSTVPEFTTPENAKYCVVSIIFVGSTFDADSFDKIMKLLPDYPISISKK